MVRRAGPPVRRAPFAAALTPKAGLRQSGAWAKNKAELAGDPSDPISYLKEFMRGEISYNPALLSQAYVNLAEQSEGSAQLAYSALAWAVRTQDPAVVSHLKKKVQALEARIEALERHSAG